jgi:hypothetical protein
MLFAVFASEREAPLVSPPSLSYFRQSTESQ